VNTIIVNIISDYIIFPSFTEVNAIFMLVNRVICNYTAIGSTQIDCKIVIIMNSVVDDEAMMPGQEYTKGFQAYIELVMIVR